MRETGTNFLNEVIDRELPLLYHLDRLLNKLEATLFANLLNREVGKWR